MIYEYHCENCNASVDVIKPVAEYDKIENCEKCSNIMKRAFAPSRVHLYNTSVQDSYFHPSLGQVVKNDSEAKKLAKAKGWIEVGNENVHKHMKPKRSEYDF